MRTFTHLKLIVPIVAEKAAGKGSAANVLHGLGAYVTRFSDPIRIIHLKTKQGIRVRDLDDLVKESLVFLNSRVQSDSSTDLFDAEVYQELNVKPPETSELQDIGNAWRAKFGTGVFTDVLLDIAEIRRDPFVVIDGLRNPGELKPLQKSLPGRHVLLGITADSEIRKKRFLDSRRRVGDPTTEEEFLRFDMRDKGIGEPPEGQQVAKCLELVSPGNMIANNSTKEALTVAVMAWFVRYGARLR